MLSLHAPAKINLYLHVTGKRPNGYHELDSLVMFADIGDTIIIEPSSNDELSFNIEGTFAGTLKSENLPDEQNLVIRAAKAYAALYGQPATYHIRLIKNLPIGAGLGGGSADAAATFKALEQYWGVSTDNTDQRTQILASLGADVPVCYHACATRFSGIGEMTQTISGLPALHVLLVYPGAHTSTPSVFKAYKPNFSAPASLPPISDINGSEALATFLKNHTSNDLYNAATQVTPIIKDTISTLEQTQSCHLARMSGSGSACFGIYPNAETAQNAAAQIQKNHPDWWVASCLL